MDKKTTHFGYQEVPVDDKVNRVADVFHSVAQRYDVMNDLMSLGIHRLWKRITISLSGVRAGQTVLDLAGGTGDLAKQFAQRVTDRRSDRQGQVILADINRSMLVAGRDRLIDEGYSNAIEFTQVNAEQLPFADNTFDCITIAFGLRNVTDKDAALQSMYRVLKPGGRLLVLEFSKPTTAWLRKTYDTYSFNVIPRIGQLVAGDKDSYQYLVESIRKHPDQATLQSMMQQAGFDQVEYHNLTGGIVAIHRGFKF